MSIKPPTHGSVPQAGLSELYFIVSPIEDASNKVYMKQKACVSVRVLFASTNLHTCTVYPVQVVR